MDDICPATDAVNEEHSQVEETDDSCKVDFIDIVPFSKDTADCCSSECVNGDWSAQVKQENLTDFVKQEPDDVCCVTFDIDFITTDGSTGSETEGTPEEDMMGGCYRGCEKS